MNESTTATVADKVADKVAGALERLVDARMLVLGMSFLMYLDIWLIKAGCDPYQMTIDDGLGKMKLLSMGDVTMFVVSYSLLMSATIPAIRVVHVAAMLNYGPHGSDSREQTAEGRQFSSWSLGFVLFTAWDFLAGHFQQGKYSGVVAFLSDRFAENGFAIDVFRISAVLFLWACLAIAFAREG